MSEFATKFKANDFDKKPFKSKETFGIDCMFVCLFQPFSSTKIGGLESTH